MKTIKEFFFPLYALYCKGLFLVLHIKNNKDLDRNLWTNHFMKGVLLFNLFIAGSVLLYHHLVQPDCVHFLLATSFIINLIVLVRLFKEAKAIHYVYKTNPHCYRDEWNVQQKKIEAQFIQKVVLSKQNHAPPKFKEIL